MPIVRKYTKKPMYAKRAYTGKGAYRRARVPSRPYRAVRGKGAYYVAGGVYGQGKLGPFKAGGALHAGYSQGNVSIPKVHGLGAYNMSNIKHNVLIKPDLPEIRNAKYREGGTIIRHREYLGPVYSSDVASSFKIDSYPLQPAQSVSFPWLAKIASSYEEYTPNGIMYEFRSTCSDAIASSSNLALGQIMLATQYDSTDQPFASDIEMLNYSWAQSGKVSDCVQHFIECASNQSPLTHLYTRAGHEVTPFADSLRFTDFGRFSIASQGLQGTSINLGQLWVTYEFVFFKPKIPTTLASDNGFFKYDNGYTNTTMSVAYPMGQTLSSGSYSSHNNLDITLSYDGATGAGYIYFPPAGDPVTYQVSLNWRGGSTGGLAAPTFSVTSGGNAVDFVNLGTTNEIPYGGGSMMGTTIWWDPYPDGSTVSKIGFTLATMMPNAYIDIIIVQVPYRAP